MRPQDVLIKQNLPGGTSAVVPPDPMPNSEVKRRSADGSVGSPHVRVGNCQASNKAESSVERLGLLFCLLSVGERSPEEDKSAGSGFERCAATARRVAGRTPAINCQASNKAESPVERPGFFAFLSSGEGADMPPPVALRLPGLRIRHGATPLWRGQDMQH